MIFAATLLAGAAAVATPAQDVADVSTRACYGLAAGTVTWPTTAGPGQLEAEGKAIRSFGLAEGLDKTAMDGLGPGGLTIVSRSTMAQRVNGTARTVLTVGPAGCRVLLVADDDAAIGEKAATALVALGWKAGPPASNTSPAIERRMFVRRDGAGKPYLLNLQILKIASGRLRLFTTVVAIPPTVQLPEGF